MSKCFNSRGIIEGYVRKDSFGRVFIDKCASDEEHLSDPRGTGEERPDCRLYLDDIILIPEENYGSNIRVSFEIQVRPLIEN